MNRLPLEILQHIISFVDLQDAYDLRLVSKRFNELAVKLVFREVIFYLHSEDLAQLVHITEFYPKCVQSLVYRGKTIIQDLTLEDLRNLYQDGQPQGRRRRRVTPLFNVELEFDRYLEALRAHEEMMHGRDDIRLLAVVLGNLPLLQSITVNCQHCFYDGSNHLGAKTPFDHLISHVAGEQFPIGVHQAEGIMQALWKSTAVLERLRIGMVDWFFFVGSSEVLRETPPSLTRLRHLELVFDTAVDELEGHAPAIVCQLAVKQGLLRGFLGSLGQLEVLTVDFSYTTRDGAYGASIDDIIPANHTWRHLRSLALRVVEDDEQKLIAVLSRHKSTLEEVCFCDIKLDSLTLPELMSEMRRTLHLKFACFCGIIWSPDDNGTERKWVIQPDTNWAHINYFCCRGSRVPDETIPVLSEPWIGELDAINESDYAHIDEYEPRFMWSPALHT